MSFVGFPSQVGNKGNEKADIAAKSALTLNISDLKIPFTDFKPSINTFVHNKWQMSWDAAVFNKLHSIKTFDLFCMFTQLAGRDFI